jgi:hypothetical protein
VRYQVSLVNCESEADDGRPGHVMLSMVKPDRSALLHCRNDAIGTKCRLLQRSSMSAMGAHRPFARGLQPTEAGVALACHDRPCSAWPRHSTRGKKTTMGAVSDQLGDTNLQGNFNKIGVRSFILTGAPNSPTQSKRPVANRLS